MESVKPVNKYLDEIVEVLQNIMNDESATNKNISDAKQLIYQTYNFLRVLNC